MDYLYSFQSLIGIFVLTGLAWALSENARAVNWRFVGVALSIQLGLVLILLKVPFVADSLLGLNAAVSGLEQATRAGTSFVFGFIGGGAPPFEVTDPGLTFSFAFQALPLVIVVSALSAMLWYWRILPMVIRGLSYVLERTMGVGGALGLGSSANVFVGMIEAPLFVRAYMERFSRTELMAMMTVGLSTVSGTVLVLYATILDPIVPGAIGHILAASIISLPAALMTAKIMVPGSTVTDNHADGNDKVDLGYHSTLDAIARGTADGLALYLQIIAMLLVMIALVALGNQILGVLPDVAGAPLTFERMIGWVMAPIAFCFGIPWNEAPTAGSLMGIKTILNELIAYIELSKQEEGVLSARSKLILLYALCGFSNLSAVGMVIAALSALVPSRREEIVSLGIKSLIGATIATSLTGAFVGLVTWGNG